VSSWKKPGWRLRSAARSPYNNHCHFFEVELVAAKPAAKTEADHELVWLPPLEVIKRLKNEGYAWAMVMWLRRPA
jgi:8-oxo-dGTP diphosphatase